VGRHLASSVEGRRKTADNMTVSAKFFNPDLEFL